MPEKIKPTDITKDIRILQKDLEKKYFPEGEPKSVEPQKVIRIEPEKAPEVALGDAARVFAPGVGFWEMNREEMIEKLAKKIYDIRINQDPNIAKMISEIGLDLRGPAIDLMLSNKRITPGTDEAGAEMRRWDRIQAGKWLEYLESQKKATQETGKREETARVAHPPEVKVEPPVAEVTPVVKSIIREGELREIEDFKKRLELKLSEGQKKIFDHLVRKSGIEKIAKALEKALEKKYREPQSEEKKNAEREMNSLLQNIKDIFKEMAKNEDGKFPGKDLNYFQRYFLDNSDVLKKYQSEREKEIAKGVNNLQNFRYQFADYMGEIAKSKEKGDFSSDIGVDLVRKYFRTYALFEQRLFEAKQNKFSNQNK